MNYDKEIINFWKTDNFKNITPKEKEFPEGWDVRTFLTDIIGAENIVEVGCGYGRLAKAFSREHYIGIDINPDGIKEAKNRNPNYIFKNFEINEKLKSSTWLLFYTVLLHVSHNDIQEYLADITKNTKKVLVAEILGKERWGNKWKYAFNRDIEDYDILFQNCGFIRTRFNEKPYKYYNNTNISFMVYEKNDN